MSAIENVPITHEFRHNMSLAVKEIVNNALKHSGATEITMTIRIEGKILLITITDNGIGLTQHAGKSGLGLDSIHQRMANIRGKCHIEPIASNGLKVSLEAPTT
jgi:signal transduction histidine kinase